MTTKASKKSSKFFILVSLLSVPFLVLGGFVDISKFIPINLPISSLIFLCPITAAIILARQDDKTNGVKLLLKRILDYRKIRNRWWLVPTFLLTPTLMFSAYLIMNWLDFSMPNPQIRFIDIAIFSAVFFVGAIGEEVGWTGYATDPLQENFGAFKAALILGIFGVIYHIIPFIQAHRTPRWIFWQCVGGVAIRFITIWLYNNTGKSVLATIIFHTTLNVSFFLFPNYGSHFDPFIFGVLLIITAIAITFLRGTKPGSVH
jgi:uncharacterized protein